jgi:hypothetical protein
VAAAGLVVLCAYVPLVYWSITGDGSGSGTLAVGGGSSVWRKLGQLRSYALDLRIT